MTRPLYLDAGAGTPLHPRAREALLAAIDAFGDPRAGHAAGRAARSVLEDARARTAAVIGGQPDEVVFTAGGAEANAISVLGLARAAGGTRVLVASVSHPSVLEAAAASGLEVVVVGCDESGRIDVDAFARQVAVPGTALASIPHAAPDVGTMQPLAECAAIARSRGVLVHADATQTAATLPIDVRALGVDLLTLSAHEAYGPPGVGALFVRRGLSVDPLLHGLPRPTRQDAGNLPGIAAMGAALEALAEERGDLADRLWGLTDHLRRALSAVEGIRLLGHPTQRVPHLVTWATDGLDGETLHMTLEDRGVMAGTPSSPTLVRAGLAEPGWVLVRMGLVRDTSSEDVDTVLEVVPAVVASLRDIAARAAAVLRASGRSS